MKVKDGIAIAIPATLAFAGVKGSELAGATKLWQQVIIGIIGAGVGLWVASVVTNRKGGAAAVAA